MCFICESAQSQKAAFSRSGKQPLCVVTVFSWPEQKASVVCQDPFMWVLLVLLVVGAFFTPGMS